MTSFISHLAPWLVYVAIFVFVASESLGVPIPGETVLLSGALVSVHPASAVSPWMVFAVGASAAMVGDSIGYLIGRRAGPHLLDRLSTRFPRHLSAARIALARDLFLRKGTLAVFLGRFVALLRILAGPMAGTVAMPYVRFLGANAAGSLTWSGALTGLVVALGAVGERWISRGSWILLVVALLIAVGFAAVVRRRVDREAERFVAAHDGHSTPAEG